MLRLENLVERCNWNRQPRDLRARNEDFTSLSAAGPAKSANVNSVYSH